jgi:hypothetical protein
LNEGRSIWRTLSSLRHRDFRLLFVGTSLSHVGDSSGHGAKLAGLDHDSSPFCSASLVFARRCPASALGHRRRYRRPNGAAPLARSTQILAMLQAFVFGRWSIFNRFSFGIITGVVLGTVNSVNQTARYSLINNLVPRDDL